ncbi:MAG: LytTR family DNA-binding domain-containing protein [Pseudomonadota bacterium]
MLGKAYSHEVHVYVSNGTVAHFTIREMYHLYTSWQMWVLILVGFLIMATGHPITLPQFDSFELRLAFWFIALFFYLVLSMAYSVLTCRLWKYVFGGPIPLIILSAPLVLASTYATGALLSVIFEPTRPPLQIMTWQMNLRNVLVAHVFETVALLWLLPAQRARRGETDAGRTITLAGRKVPLANISRVKAAEHYLEIHGFAGTKIMRERMATFLDQVTPADGIQTHRSHWVAADNVRDIKGSKLILKDGGEVPIARGRQDAVRQWIAEARPDSQDSVIPAL